MNNRIIIIVLAFALFAVVIPGLYMNAAMRKYQKEVKSIKVRDVNLSRIADGTYTGSAKAVMVSAKVEVTVEGHEIVKILLLEHMHGRGERAEVIPQRVIDRQSLNVNAISGATASSKVILKAIENALRKR